MPKYKCRFAETCPAATGWCLNSVPNGDCLERVIGLYNTMADGRGVIVVQVNAFVKDEVVKQLHKQMVQQLASGIITVPPWAKAIYCPSVGSLKMEDGNGPVRKNI